MAAALFLAGCAGYPDPTQPLALSEAAIAFALAAGAPEPAASRLERAQLEAELAVLKTISAKAMREATRQTAEFRRVNRKAAFDARRPA